MGAALFTRNLRVTFGTLVLVLPGFLGLALPQPTHAQEAEIQFPVTVSTDNGSQKLTLGLDPAATDSVDAEFNEVPPPPSPSSFSARLIDEDVAASGFGNGVIFDIRQGSTEFTGPKRYQVSFRASLGADVTISWELPRGITGTIEDEYGGDEYAANMNESDSVTVSSPAPDAIVKIEPKSLPVELTGFDAQRTDGTVRLSWQTASETNNAGFYVQRKQREAQWQRLGFVESKARDGTTSDSEGVRDYRFTDTDLPYAVDSLTYRLRQADIDGTANLSGETVVRLAPPNQLTLHSPFPNPARRQARLRFETPRPTEVRVAVYDLLGRQVKTLVDGHLDAGRHTELLPVSSLVPGMYFVRLRGNGTSRTRKFTVVR